MLTFKERLTLTDINYINEDIVYEAKNEWEKEEMIYMIARRIEEIGIEKYIDNMTLTNQQLNFSLN